MVIVLFLSIQVTVQRAREVGPLRKAGIYFLVATLPLCENRSGTKLERTSLSTGVFQRAPAEIYSCFPQWPGLSGMLNCYPHREAAKEKDMFRKTKGLHFYKKRKTISVSLLKELGSWGFFFVLAVLLAFVFVYSVGIKTSVIGASMEPCLYNGEGVLINKISYSFRSPKRGDVIVFLPNGNENAHYYIKRVVGMPGETITITEGRILLNGYFYEEGDSYDTIEDGGIAERGITLGEDEYFVLGDNRNNSEDSRSANIGAVKENTIAGKAWFRIGSDIDRVGFIK